MLCIDIILFRYLYKKRISNSVLANTTFGQFETLKKQTGASNITWWVSRCDDSSERRSNWCGLILANTDHWPNVDLMLGQRPRRWPSNKSALGERLLFAVYHSDALFKPGCRYLRSFRQSTFILDWMSRTLYLLSLLMVNLIVLMLSLQWTITIAHLPNITLTAILRKPSNLWHYEQLFIYTNDDHPF